jgi:hypothetical protein
VQQAVPGVHERVDALETMADEPLIAAAMNLMIATPGCRAPLRPPLSLNRPVSS